jgi:hypothetical protein
MDKEYKRRFWIHDYFLRIYNNIQSDYSYRITSVYRREVVSIVTRVAVATKIAVAKSCAAIMGPFTTLMHWKNCVGTQYIK